MFDKRVKDLMLTVDDYPTINGNASMLDAFEVLSSSQVNVKPGNQPFRAILVLDDEGKVIGKVGHLSFLRALEPKYREVFDIDKLTRASMSPSYLDSMLEHFNLWDTDQIDVCTIAKHTKVSDIMQPITESIDENESISNAIHKLIMWQSLSLLVSSGQEIVGIIRLSDIYNAIEQYAIENCKT